MRPVDVHAEAVPVRVSPAPTIESSTIARWRNALSQAWTRVGLHPATVFVLLSLVFGSLVSLVTPPLRGPDEISHFLRIYAYARGELLPAVEVDGRKGIFVERELYHQLSFFSDAGELFATNRERGVRYGQIMALYRDFTITVDDELDRPTVFAPFAGAGGYSPVAYAPYIIGAATGRLLGLDLPEMLLLMRLLGLAAFTAVAAYAIAATPVLKWPFVLIALLPVSLYNRSVLSADGAAFSAALAITAVCLKHAWDPGAARAWERSLWMTLCALSKQPQIAFIILELAVSRLRELPRRWTSAAMVVLPGLILSPLWVIAVSADIGAWRLQEEGYHPPEHFDPIWKLRYMWEHPFHFPLATWNALSDWGDRLWPEFIGILGWQDIHLPTWTYLVLTALLILVPVQRLQLDGATRARIGVVTGLAALGYIVLVYLIFFLTYTPLDVDHVRGVQGRYFVIVLPVAAIFVATVINRELPAGMSAAIAIAGSMIAGISTVEALRQAHWY
jgi:uncharacterized membrane protein